MIRFGDNRLWVSYREQLLGPSNLFYIAKLVGGEI